MRRKLGELSVQMKATDRACSLYVRKRDGRCVICGSTQNLQAGHLISRVCKSVRFDCSNVFAVCSGHNLLHEYRPEVMTEWWVKTFGPDAYSALVAKSKQIRKWTVDELRELEDGFNKLTEELEQ